MDYRVFVLILRLLLGTSLAFLSGLILWFTGNITIVPLIPNNIAVVTANLVVGVGIGAGLAGWFFGIRVGSSHNAGPYELPIAIALAVAFAWFGQLFLADLLFSNVDAVRVKTTNEIYGAVTGAVIGAMVLPLAIGLWRTAHRQEP
ncbi:MAG: hypothetical protein HY678_11555 [Chloroflexi bacterium]|nr:hypothetical protein [Chloroflexota bacterium]